jgi:Lipase (class 3)
MFSWITISAKKFKPATRLSRSPFKDSCSSRIVERSPPASTMMMVLAVRKYFSWIVILFVAFTELVHSVAIDASTTFTEDSSSFPFTQELLQITLKAVNLCNNAYDSDPVANWNTFQYDSIQVFKDNNDQAILVSFEGYCMLGFRGTDTSSWSDIYQNLKTGNEQVCSAGKCCNAERVFYDSYNSGYRVELENAVRECTSQCTTVTTAANETTTTCPQAVITGSSQGGGTAVVASMYFHDLIPVVITFGQSPVVDMPCRLVDEDRTFRFENSRVGARGTTYDPVPYLPYKSSHYGNQFMLGEDSTSVAYIGQNAEIKFEPWDADNFFAVHRLTSKNVGYIHRIEALANANKDAKFIRSSGFIDGTPCSRSVECDSKICFNELCVRRP